MWYDLFTLLQNGEKGKPWSRAKANNVREQSALKIDHMRENVDVYVGQRETLTSRAAEVNKPMTTVSDARRHVPTFDWVESYKI